LEEGNVSSQIIIEIDGRPQRIKTPSDRTREVRVRIEQALLSYHDVGSYAEFEQAVAPDEEPESDPDRNVSFAEDDEVFGSGVDPLDANPPELDEEGLIIEELPGEVFVLVERVAKSKPETGGADGAPDSEVSDDASDVEETTGLADSGFEFASETLDDSTEVQLAALTEAVERQNERLERQQRTIERLVEELTRAR
jgi:hypothetical protein